MILKTRKLALSDKIALGSSEWELRTYLDQISLNMEQRANQLEVKANVNKLEVTDNSSDERFPFIFRNVPVEGQQDLVTFKLRQIEKSSPDFVDCDTFIDLGFSGLVAYWKPQSMINLLKFIDSHKPKETEPSPEASASTVELDMDLKQRIHEGAVSGGAAEELVE